MPLIIGGIEGSLRRFAHYDYWDDKVRRSIILDAKADLIIYGMGERAIVETAEALDSGIDIKDIGWIRGTTYKLINHGLRDGVSEEAFEEGNFSDNDTIILPSYDEIKSSSSKD